MGRGRASLRRRRGMLWQGLGEPSHSLFSRDCEVLNGNWGSELRGMEKSREA